MEDSFLRRFKGARRRWIRSLGTDISTPFRRALAWIHFGFVDHAILRLLWTNRYEISPGVFRSNQPGPRRVAKEARRGIKTIIALRGRKGSSSQLFEEEAADKADIRLEFIGLSAKRLAPKEDWLRLLDLFDTLEKPFLFHCKSGADRTGIASALYLMANDGIAPSEAQKQLHWWYLHSRRSKKTGILIYTLKRMEEDLKADPMTVREWFETRFDKDAMTSAYRASRGLAPQ